MTYCHLINGCVICEREMCNGDRGAHLTDPPGGGCWIGAYAIMGEESKKMNDPVNHPAHYTQGKIECIDFITDKKLNFCRGNAVKYIVRAGIKDPDKEVEDLEKAVFYLNREIADLKARSLK